MKKLSGWGCRTLYYMIGRFLPKYPIPGYKISYKIRYFLCKHIFAEIGKNVLIKRNAYFGDGARCIILPGVSIGDNCIIGANTVVTKDVPENAVFCGSEGRVVKLRG